MLRAKGGREGSNTGNSIDHTFLCLGRAHDSLSRSDGLDLFNVVIKSLVDPRLNLFLEDKRYK